MSKSAGKEKRSDTTTPLSRNKHLFRWVEKMAELTRPVHHVRGYSHDWSASALEPAVPRGTLSRDITR